MVAMGVMTSFDLGVQGRTVVVAGAGGDGIGTGVSAMLVRAGATVLGLDVDRDALALTERAAGPDAARFVPALADVTDTAAVDDALTALDGLPPLLGLVHVVGGMPFDDWSLVTGMPPATFAAVVELNLQTAFITTQAVARRLVARGDGGSIVLVSSISGTSAPAGRTSCGWLTTSETCGPRQPARARRTAGRQASKRMDSFGLRAERREGHIGRHADDPNVRSQLGT